MTFCEDCAIINISKKCNVVVIGGGTAGLEAACTAAEVGCNTFLLEKGETLGGLASIISKIPAKKRLADFPNYLIHRAEQLDNLYIFKNTGGGAVGLDVVEFFSKQFVKSDILILFIK